MAHVEKRGTRYLAVWQRPDGRRTSKMFDRKRDAERHLAVNVTAVLRGDYVDPDAGRITLREYAERWIATRATLGPTTRAKYLGQLRYLDVIGDMPIAALTPEIVEQWQAGLLLTRGRPLAPSTVLVIRAGLKSILRSAVRDRRIIANPFDGVAKPTVARRRVEPMPVETVLAIRDTITPWYSAAVAVGAGCGLRWGEVFGLTVDRVDMLRKTIRVDRQITRTTGAGWSHSKPKTDTSRRVVPMPAFVVDALAAHLARWPRQRGDLIFQSRGGKPVDSGLFADAWRRVAPAGTHFHDLRHFYASLLIADGASVPEVQARLGHATAKETLDTYSHLWPSHEDNTRRIIDAAFAPKPAADTPGETGTV